MTSLWPSTSPTTSQTHAQVTWCNDALISVAHLQCIDDIPQGCKTWMQPGSGSTGLWHNPTDAHPENSSTWVLCLCTQLCRSPSCALPVPVQLA
jgi:hypothetical protein